MPSEDALRRKLHDDAAGSTYTDAAHTIDVSQVIRRSRGRRRSRMLLATSGTALALVGVAVTAAFGVPALSSQYTTPPPFAATPTDAPDPNVGVAPRDQGITPTTPGPTLQAGGVPATWQLTDPGDVGPESTSLEVMVTRLECSSGVTGELLEPVVAYEADRIVIQIDAAPKEPVSGEPAGEDCISNNAVPMTVDLTESVGDRELVDGACTHEPAQGTAPCVESTGADPAIAKIVVRPEMLQLVDEAGTELSTISYDAEAAEFVTLFTDLMGVDPAIEEYGGGMETPPATRYTWDGFVLTDYHEKSGLSGMNVRVLFTKPELGPHSIAASTIQGFQPGDDLQWLAEYMDEPYREDLAWQQVQAEHGAPVGEPVFPDSKYSNSYSVVGQTNRPGSESTVIFAPTNLGIGGN